MRGKRDGQPIPGTEGTITAAQQNAALGIDTTAPKPARLPLTPEQARRQMAGEWIGEDLDPPDWEASVVSDPTTVAKVLGLRPEDFDTAPLGSQPEGQPIAQPDLRPKIEPRPERRPDDVSSTPPPPSATDASAKAKLAADFRAHAAKVAELAESAKQSGDAAREAKAAAEVRASTEVGEALKARGVL